MKRCQKQIGDNGRNDEEEEGEITMRGRNLSVRAPNEAPLRPRGICIAIGASDAHGQAAILKNIIYYIRMECLKVHYCFYVAIPELPMRLPLTNTRRTAAYLQQNQYFEKVKRSQRHLNVRCRDNEYLYPAGVG